MLIVKKPVYGDDGFLVGLGIEDTDNKVYKEVTYNSIIHNVEKKVEIHCCMESFFYTMIYVRGTLGWEARFVLRLHSGGPLKMPCMVNGLPVISLRQCFGKNDGTYTDLTGLDFSDMDTKYVEDMSAMFRYCIYRGTLDLRSFNLGSCSAISRMFCNCDMDSIILDFGRKNQITHAIYFAYCARISKIKLMGRLGCAQNMQTMLLLRTANNTIFDLVDLKIDRFNRLSETALGASGTYLVTERFMQDIDGHAFFNKKFTIEMNKMYVDKYDDLEEILERGNAAGGLNKVILIVKERQYED